MLKLLSQKKVKENWEKYRTHIETAMTSSEGGLLVSEGPKDIYKSIFEMLMNPFNQSMHLWSEGDEDYIVLTKLQMCGFTEIKSLVLFSSTRTKDVDKDLLDERYYEAYKSISKFARDNKCVGMYCYSDLDYFAEMAKKTKEWTKVITRYQFYFPLD
ncbi:uncharacterized protein METZ01_LOCUS213739 [marine metagenome]|uniref:Uncharacterized protein n=1 Tax=marine metagenome TaxID=408172 RepID=A0A382FDW4_9ZZZZ